MLLKALKDQKWAILWSVLILLLCNIKISNEVSSNRFFFEGFDKLAHTGFFFVLSVLLFYGKIKSQHNFTFRLYTIVKVLLICAFIGGVIELLQWKVFTYRGAEWWDFVCDMIGTCMGILSFVLLHAPDYIRNKVS